MQSRRNPGTYWKAGTVRLLLAAGLLLAGLPPAPGRAAPAVALPRYVIEATLDFDAAVLDARQTVRFTNLTGQPLDTVVLRSLAGALGALSLGALRVEGQPVAPTVDASGSVLEVPLPATLAPGAAVEVGLDWSLGIPRVPGRLTADGAVVSLGNWYPTLAVHRGDWDRRPYTEVGDAFFTEVADVDVRLDLSRPAVVASTGDVVSQAGRRWELAARGVRDFALAVSPDYHRAEAPLGDTGTVVSVYTLDPARAGLYLQAAAEFAQVFGDLVGPYPYARLSVAETPLPAGYAGMEYPQLVFLAPELSAADFPRSPAREVLAHEVAHQWFYGLIGNDQLDDPWLDEAFTTYVTVQGYERVSPDLADALAALRLAPAGDGEPVDRGVFEFPSDPPYFRAIYGQGGRFVAELRQALGEDAWGRFLRDLYWIYRDKVATPRAVLDLAFRLAPDPHRLHLVVDRYTRYEAFDYPERDRWTLGMPAAPWQGQVPVALDATFPITSVELWLDGRLLAGGARPGTYLLDAAGMPAGEYVLLARVVNDLGIVFERAERVTILP